MIELDHVACVFDGGFRAVDDLSLRIAEGEFRVLIGASGSGKSTTLRLINRLQEASAGSIRFAGEDIARIRPELLRRRMGYVIQGGGLFPHWTVERNIATVPLLLGWAAPRVEARVAELLALLQLDAARLRRAYPHQLSGGQQQRVGVARALAADPDVLLMDEPFGALDPITRAGLQAEMRRIHRETGKTIVFVTHDMDEAVTLGSRIALLDRGRLVQEGTPLQLLTDPANELVRSFIGSEDRGLKLLSVQRAADRLVPGELAPGAAIAGDISLRAAMSEMVTRGTDRLPVADGQGGNAGTLHLADLVRPAPQA